MRTPWRFLSDLVTRKPTAGHVDDHSSEDKVEEPKKLPSPDRSADLEFGSIEAGTDHGTAEILPANADGATSGETAEQDIATSADQGAAVEEPIVSRADLVSVPEASHSDELTVNPAERKSPEKAPERKPPVTRTKTRSPRVAVEQPAEIAENEGLEAVSRAKTFFDEMAELDAEISSLRKQLSEKLVVQNEQLRKMVQRFDSI